MSETEPALLRDSADGSSAPRAEPAQAARTEPPAEPVLRQAGRAAPTVYVASFFQRAAAALVDLVIVVPVGLLITLIVSKISGVRLAASNIGLFDFDMWIDLVLATDPALIMAFVLMIAIGLTYLLVFHIVLGRTLGMRLLKLRVIDVYGDRPSPARCVARCAGYLAGAATLFLGFLWIGFDSEKRGLQDWIAGTYVIRA